MKCLVALIFCTVFSLPEASYLSSHASVSVGPTTNGAIVKGPASASAIVGPDGSRITSAADSGSISVGTTQGGAISRAHNLGYVPRKPVYASYASNTPHFTSYVASIPPFGSYTSHITPYTIHDPEGHLLTPLPYAFATPLVKSGTVISGPSGTIKTSGSAHGYIAKIPYQSHYVW
ncbi:uncharacterized protein LOC108733245 [Agrilus planipennis]|uniref:Uncharacterized protein LOC108733245 n=1 Tax=Agrilus planipennis TaxID=224129 RepID=A0A1W4WHA1_AGRPL|nr:uncharacterized protein LOC108733245 [Agrilus planipennis]